MDITPTIKPKRKRTIRSPEFYALCRKARGQGEFAPKREVTTQFTKREKAMELDEMTSEPPRSIKPVGPIKPPKPVKPPKPPVEKHFRHAMTRDKRTKEWRVRIPSPKGRTRYVTTGEKEISKALKVVDTSGVPQLSVLARAKCLTQNAAAIILAGPDKTCEEVKKTWLRDLALDQSANTCKAYEMYIGLLLRKNDCEKKPVSELTREIIHGFVNEPETKCNTRQTRLSAVKSFYRHAAGFGHVVGNIASTVKVTLSSMTVDQRESKPAIPITEAEYRLIMASHQIPRFWRVATSLGYWLGLRLVDVCKLERASIGEDFAVLYPHKTGRRLVLPVHDPLIGSGELKTLFHMLLEMTPPEQVLCFPEHSKMYDKCVPMLSMEYSAALESIGIKGKTFHGLRHAFRLRLTASGKPIEEISRLMGHASVKTTEGYGRGAIVPLAQPPSSAASSPSAFEDSEPLEDGDSNTVRSQTA